MASLFAHLLLIAGLVLCPFRCQTILLGCTPDCPAEPPKPSCCSGCHQPATVDAADEPERPPHHHQRPACEQCQCICGGALVEKPGHDGLLEAARIAVPAGRDAVCVETLPLRAEGGRHPPPVVAGLSTGRAICTLHRSFLC